MNDTARIRLIYILLIALVGIVASVAFAAIASAAPADTCDPAYTAQCCACEPSEAAEPAPLPRLYLPSVQRNMPAMSAETTPFQPVPTVTPDPPVTGDVQ